MKLKKALSSFLVLVLLLSCMSFTALADGSTTSITYLTPVYNTAGDPTSGIQSWSSVEKNDVKIATSISDISAGGWLVVTSDLSTGNQLTVSSDLNLYILNGAKFECGGLNAAGHTVTLYGNGTFRSNDTSTATTFVFNGPTLWLNGANGAGGSENQHDGGNGNNAIVGNVILNAGSGRICAGFGGDSYSVETEEDFNIWGYGGNAGDCVVGSLHINGSSVDTITGCGGDGEISGSNGKNANKISLGTNVILKQYGTFCDAKSLDNTYNFNVCEIHDLISSSSLNTQGGVSFTVGDTSSAKNAPRTATVTATVTPVDGYTVSLSAKDADYDDVALTKGTADNIYTFTMPATAVTVTATYSPITAGSDYDLDLEESTTAIPYSKSIDQYYKKTTGSVTTINNRISISWVSTVASIRVSDAQKWDPTTLTWVQDEANYGTATVVEGTNVTTFTLKNYSINAFTCTMSFKPTAGNEKYFEETAATFDANNGTDIAAVERGTDGNALAKYYVDGDTSKAVDDSKVPTLTITGTLNIDTTAFKNAVATPENVQYGNYTIICKKVAQ